MPGDEKVSVALSRPDLVVGRSEVVTVEDGTRDGGTQSPDDVRIDRLKSSIAKIQDQIERVRRELDSICEVLRGNSDDGGPCPGATRDGIAIGTGIVADTSTTQTTHLTNEEILEQARVTVNGHIKMLTRYNELKDVAMVLFELIAQYQGKRVGEVLREKGVEVDD